MIFGRGDTPSLRLPFMGKSEDTEFRVPTSPRVILRYPPASRVGRFRTLAIFLILAIAPLYATPSLDIRSSVEKSEIRIGDRFFYRIEVLCPDSGRVELPGVVGNLGAFEVLEYSPSTPLYTDSGMVNRWELKLSTFLSGNYVIPPQLVEYTPASAPEGFTPIRLETEAVRIKVLKRNPEDASDILGPEGPMKPKPASPWLWLLVGLGALIVIFLIFFLWKKRKKSKKTVPRLPPWEEADLALRELLDKELWKLDGEDSRQDEHAHRLTALFKTFVARRFHLPAEESTSGEFVRIAEGISILTADLQTRLKIFVEKTDLVKFARIKVAEEEFEEQNLFVRNFLDYTKPRPEEKSKDPEGKA